MATSVKTTTFTRTSKTGEVQRVLDLVRDRKIQVVDVKFCDLPGRGSTSRFRPPRWRRTLPGRARLRRVVHSRIPGDQRERHAPAPRPGHRVRGSGARGADALAHLRHLRPDHAGALLPRSAVHRLQGRGVPQDHRHRDHVVLGTGGGVLHLQLGAVRPERARGLLPHRFGRGDLELRPERHAQPGSPPPLQGGLLPRAAGGPAAGRALEDHARADRSRGAGRSAAPRGGHRGPGGDRLPIRHAGADRRPA